jgi:prephenate dehydrogenase
VERVTIIGTGLIGGSIGLALKAAKLPQLEVVGFDLDRDAISEARKRGAIDRGTPNLPEAVREARLVILAAPPLALRGLMQEISEHLPEGAIVTDTASTKVEVRRWAREFLPEHVSYIGGHPMAGKETQGIKHADAELFKGATYCVIPTPRASEGAMKSILGLVNILGAEPLFIDAEEHDQYAAAISHMPLVVSTALFSLVRTSPAWADIAPMVAGGFKDVTRLASGDPRMSHDILATNADGVIHWIDRLVEELQSYRTLLQTDRKALFKRFSETQLQRDAFMLGERPERKPVMEMPNTKDAVSGMLFGGMIASRMDKFEKDMGNSSKKRRSVLDEDED